MKELEQLNIDSDVGVLPDETLQFFHKAIHLYYKINCENCKKPIGWSGDDILCFHQQVVTELGNRGLKHDLVDVLDSVEYCVTDRIVSEKSVLKKVYVSSEQLSNALF